jgi:hypothetical protein
MKWATRERNLGKFVDWLEKTSGDSHSCNKYSSTSFFIFKRTIYYIHTHALFSVICILGLVFLLSILFFFLLLVSMSPATAHSHQDNEVNLSEYDAEQVRLMEERCIIIDENDRRIGAESKKACKYPLLLLLYSLIN